MRSLSRNRVAMGICIVTAVLSTGRAPDGVAASSRCDEGVDVQIVTDKSTYASGAIMHVKLLVTNTGKTPFYLFHDIGQCTNPLGWLSLDLRDLHNYEVEHWLCSLDDFFMATRDVVEILSNPKTGVLLEQGEIFGREEDYDLPKRKGTYRLHAELAPAGLTEDQRQALSQHQMRVLRATCLAPTVTITVR